MTDGPAATPPTRGVRAGPSASAPASAVRKQTRPGSLTWTWPASAPLPTRERGPRAAFRATASTCASPPGGSPGRRSRGLRSRTSQQPAGVLPARLPHEPGPGHTPGLASAQRRRSRGRPPPRWHGLQPSLGSVGSGDDAEIDRAMARATDVAVHGPSEFWARGLGDQQNRPREASFPPAPSCRPSP